MRTYILGFGGLQVVVTSALISAVCYYFTHLSAELSIIIGSALSMSSTAIVMEVIEAIEKESSKQIMNDDYYL